MGEHPAVVAVGQPVGKEDRVPLDHDVEIKAGTVQEQVAHESADDKHRQVDLVRFFRQRVQQRQTGWRHNFGKLFRYLILGGHIRRRTEGFQQVCAGDDPDDLTGLLRDDGHLAPIGFSHQVLQGFQ